MSKYTKSPLCRIIKTSAKIAHYEQRLTEETGKRRHRIHEKICGLKRSLRHYSKLYIWNVGSI